jgi:predicted SAM-dependent methyltransferase
MRTENNRGIKFLNLGCGSHYHPEWININFTSESEHVIAHDLLKGIPFQENIFGVVYHSHLLEHFPKDRADYLIDECYRVLKKQGIIRVVVPDLEIILQNYFIYLPGAIDDNPVSIERYRWTILELFDQMVREKPGGEMKRIMEKAPDREREFIRLRIGKEVEDFWKASIQKKRGNLFRRVSRKSLGEVGHFISQQIIRTIIRLVAGPEGIRDYDIGQFRMSGEVHYWMYDRYSLGELLRQAGFQDVKVCDAFTSRISNYEKYELDVVDGAVRKPDSLFMEGIKI